MAENPVFDVRARTHSSRARISLLLVVALFAVLMSPTERSSTRTASAVSASPSLVCSGSTCTWTFPYTGDYYDWTVPAGVSQIGFDVYGAQGGDGGPSAGGLGSVKAGGLGGRVQGKLSVTPGNVLRIYVGGKGTNHSLSGVGGFNGGGSTAATSDDNRRPGAGGGASDIRTSSTLQSRLVVAGGGGGASGWMAAVGGAGGGLIGEAAPGPYWCTSGGKGGTQSAGGAIGNCGGATSGSLGVGGNGKGNSHGGGGGGGGYYGGGGATIDGGGGGSSYTDAALATEVTHTQGNRSGNGLVVLTMLRPGVSSFAATVASPSNQSSQLTYNLQFSESVTDLLQSEITLGGTSTGWSISSFSGSGASYVVGLTGTNVTSGTVVLTVAQDAVISSVTSQTGPSAATNSSAMTIDLDPPTASVASAPSSPAAGMTLTFGLSFSESVSGIAAGDFSNLGTAVGCVFTPSAASGTSINVVVTQCQEGTLQLRLAANGVSDAATNTGPVAALTSSVITLQASALTITAGAKSINYGGSWTDSYTQSGLIAPDSISSVSYSYSGTTTLGTSYGPSGTKPTAGGTYTITPVATFNPANTNRYAVSYVSASLTIARIAQSALTISTTTGTYGSTLSLATSGGSGTGAVTYSVSSGSCTVNGSVLTLGEAGSSCSVTATKAADDNYTQASSAATSISTAKAAQSVLSISTTTATYGQDLVLGMTGGSGTGAVSYQVVSGTCSIVGALLTPGNAGSSCVIKVTKATDTNYLERSSSNTTITINKASQTGLSVTSALSFTTGSTLTLTATGGQSSGSLSWSLSSGQCSLNGTSLTATRGGISCDVEVTRAGDTNYLSRSVTVTISVDKIVQVLTFQSTPPSSPVVGGTYTVQVTSDASLAPTVSIASNSASVCSISAGVVTFNTAGTCVISATQSGNDTYAAAAASQSITVSVVPTTSTTVAPVSGSGGNGSSPSTTIPQSAVPAPVSTSSTTTTTTTTTTIPADPGSPNLDANGEAPSLDAGEATAVVRGKRVKVLTKAANGVLTMTLPGNVIFTIGTTNSASGGAQVGADGVLKMYGNSSLDVGVSGFVPKTTYTVYMFSDPVELGRGEASSKGTVNDTVIIPKDAEAGEHTLQVNGVGPGDEVISVSMGFEIVERESNTRIAVLVITLAVALALLGGRPIFRRRRRA